MVQKGTLLYGSMDMADTKGAAEYIGKLLHGVTIAHMHHLMTDSYAKHKALGELYEDLPEKIDALAEVAMNCMGERLSFSAGQFDLSSNSITDLDNLYTYAKENRLMVGTESHVLNQVDEVISCLGKALYKLKMLEA
jgi:hypothetical protein